MVDHVPKASHVRPKKRTPLATTTASATIVEETRQRVETWVKHDDQPTRVVAIDDSLKQAAQQTLETVSASPTKPKLQGILKTTNKYSTKIPEADSDTLVSQVSEQEPIAVRDVVVERRRSKQKPVEVFCLPKPSNRETAETISIEGYAPTTGQYSADRLSIEQQKHGGAGSFDKAEDIQPDNDMVITDDSETQAKVSRTQVSNEDKEKAPENDTEPLIFDSLADLMEAAGTLPNTSEPPLVVEAGLEFSVMDPNEYQEVQQESQEEQYQVFLGTRSIPDDGTAPADKENQDDLWDLFDNPLDLGNESDTDDTLFPNEDNDPAAEKRAFFKLWQAISQWVTPEAVSYICHLQSGDTEYYAMRPVDQSDLSASRCAGLLALLQMHISSCLVNDLGRSVDEIRTAERCLANLLRCFDFRRPMPKLDTAHARALACILLDTVLCTTAQDPSNDPKENRVPNCCKLIGMNQDEYRYLTKSAIVSFGSPTDGPTAGR